MSSETFQSGGITLPRIDAVAARSNSGQLWLAITNLDPNRSARIEITSPAIKSATGDILSSSKIDSINTFENTTFVSPKPIAGRVSGHAVTLTLTPHSVAVVALGT
jgi:alpha-N-arabinofuranosidase